MVACVRMLVRDRIRRLALEQQESVWLRVTKCGDAYDWEIQFGTVPNLLEDGWSTERFLQGGFRHSHTMAICLIEDALDEWGEWGI